MPQNSKRADLLRAGMTAVHERGFSNTGVADIAKLSGAPKGSFYNHFASKDDFGAAVLNAYFALVESNLKTILEGPVCPPIERLGAYFSELRDYNRRFGFARGCLIGNIAAEAAGLSPGTQKLIDRLMGDWGAALARCLREGQQHGDVRKDCEAEVLGRLLLDAWQGAVLRSKVERRATSLDAFIDVLLPALIRPPARARPAIAKNAGRGRRS